MASTSLSSIVRPATSLEEASGVWYPLMESLGWTRSAEDGQTHFHSTGSDGFLVIADACEPSKAEGCIVPLVYANNTGWIGFFCINEPHRGKGWGANLFNRALDHFREKKVEVVGLDAVTQQVQTYARRGFVEKAKIQVLSRLSTISKPLDGLMQCPPGKRLMPLEDIPSEVLVKSDLEHSGLERSRLWTKEALFDRDDVFGFALVDEAKGHETLDGWVLVRGCQIGFRVGPLYATTSETASLLLWNVLKRYEDHDAQFIAELWAGNPAAETVFRGAGFDQEVVHYHRMWLNGNVPKPQLPGGKADQEAYAIFDAGEG
jgi:GNAT superfamily N-acetyltransferase